MNDERLAKHLKSIGKACFVKHFDLFANLSLPPRKTAELLKRKEPGYTPTTCYSRASAARSICRAGRAKEALINVSSSRVPPDVSERARNLASKL